MIPNPRTESGNARLTALDAALLFFSSFLAFAYVTIFVLLDVPAVGVIESLPIIITGVLLPLYVGYMRGAVQQDSLLERMRGWIYLLVGSGMYTIQFVFSQFPAVITDPYALPGFGLFVALMLLLVTFPRRFVLWAYKYLRPEKTITLEERVALGSTAVGIFFGNLFLFSLGTAGVLLSRKAYPIQAQPLVLLVGLLGSFILFSAMVLIEINCHHYVSWAAAQLKKERETGMTKSETKSMMSRVFNYGMSANYLLFAGGVKHRNQYVLLAIALAIQLLGLIVNQTTLLAGLTLQSTGIVLTLWGLWWHASTPPDQLSTSKLAEKIYAWMKSARRR